jgi:hypothetical protein
VAGTERGEAVRLLISLILILGLATVGNGRQGSDSHAERLRVMRAFATGITVDTDSPEAHQKVERLAEPIYRFADPARHVSDGTVWAWCRSGRPAALVTVTKHRPPAGVPHWLTELTSLSPASISATIDEIGMWRPSGAGVVMQAFPKAPVPADDATKRLRQMKELARQLKAHENSRQRVERYELRLLPQPVHRYEDAKSGLIDGGMFIIAYGQNPEIVLLMEASRHGSSAPAWHCGFARISMADLHVEFESKEIWSHQGGFKGPDDTYWLFTRPIVGE